ncbi:LpqN/LpqT family lipoprotein [Prescottella defluvii]|nr:LpqN/LpqT family lipoprotein [Prescottella defluvii]
MLDYLDENGLECSPCCATDPAVPVVTVPVLPGWTKAAPDAFPGAWMVLLAPECELNGFTPNAVVLHGELSGRVDADQLLGAARRTSSQLPDWQEEESSHADFLGHRSLFVRGAYNADHWMLASTTRFLITERAGKQYLTQLTVTNLVEQMAALETDVMVINLGLDIRSNAGA